MVLTKASLLELQVAQRLGDLSLDGNELAGVLERSAVELGELAQELASPQGLGTGERRDGVQRVEQEMRVDLGLQRADLGAGGELGLALELVHRELGGEQLGKTRCQRILGTVDVARGAEIELECSHGLPAHHEWRDDARRNVAAASPLTAHVHHVGEGLGDTVIDDIARGGGVNGRPRRKILRELAHASEDDLTVGDGDGHRTGMRQQAAADLLGALVCEAAGDVLEHLGRDGERLLGVLGAQRVRREERVDEREDQDHEQRERREGRDRFDAREDGVAEQADQRDNRHRAQQAYGGKRIDRGQAARTSGDSGTRPHILLVH